MQVDPVLLDMVGAKIKKFRFADALEDQAMGFRHDPDNPTPMIILDNGCALAISCDAEGNGAGFINVAELDGGMR